MGIAWIALREAASSLLGAVCSGATLAISGNFHVPTYAGEIGLRK